MTGVIITFFVALVGLFLLFKFLLPVDEAIEQNNAVPQGYAAVPGLSAVLSPDMDRLLGKDDYHRLRARPELESVRRRFWWDRRRIAVMWLAELQRDVRLLWEFRRFLVRNGLHVTLREEVGVGFAGLTALAYLKIIRAVIFLFGPFAVPGAMRNARHLVQVLSIRDVALLARVPSLRKADIEQKWAQHILLLRVG